MAAKRKKPRNYRKEYDEYHGTPTQRKNRAASNRARRALEKEGRVSKGDGKEVDHKDKNPRNNSRKNLRVVSRRTNRTRKK